jgi:hypothetical protein
LIIPSAKRVRHARSGLIVGVRWIPPPPSFPQSPANEPDQWEALLASAADREKLEDTWEEWNAGVEKLIAEFQARGIPHVRVPLDIEEIKQFCEEQDIANDGKARAALAARKAEQYPNVEN